MFDALIRSTFPSTTSPRRYPHVRVPILGSPETISGNGGAYGHEMAVVPAASTSGVDVRRCAVLLTTYNYGTEWTEDAAVPCRNGDDNIGSFRVYCRCHIGD